MENVMLLEKAENMEILLNCIYEAYKKTNDFNILCFMHTISESKVIRSEVDNIEKQLNFDILKEEPKNDEAVIAKIKTNMSTKIDSIFNMTAENAIKEIEKRHYKIFEKDLDPDVYEANTIYGLEVALYNGGRNNSKNCMAVIISSYINKDGKLTHRVADFKSKKVTNWLADNCEISSEISYKNHIRYIQN